MNYRERFINNVLGKDIDRVCYFLYWPPWKTTMRRWLKEGSFKNNDYSDEVLFLHKEIYSIFNPDIPPQTLPLNCGPFPLNSRTIISEDEDFVTFIDNWGIKRRDFKKKESMSEFIEFPVKNRSDWEKFKHEKLNPDHPRRMDGDWEEIGLGWMNKGYPVQMGGYPDVGVFGAYRWLLGDEEGLIAFSTEPELVYDIMDHLTTLYLSVFEKVVKRVRVDVIHVFEDIAFRNGPLFSPKHFNQFILPQYKRIKKFADGNNIPIFSFDTDGNFYDLILSLAEAGVNLISPIEVAAGMDINRLRDLYPLMGFMGGIDKRVLAIDRKAIDNELSRIKKAVEKGRYIPFLDHLIPDDVPWENYCYYADSLKKMIFSN